MENQIKPGKYRHFKGNEYEVLGIANHSETMEEMVVYRALYGEQGLWVRPASMWNETVERDGKCYQRFTYIGEDADSEDATAAVNAPVSDDTVLIDQESMNLLVEALVGSEAETDITLRKVNLQVVLEAFEEATNNWTYYYDLQNHENIYIFASRFMDDEEEREMVEAEPDRFVKLPKKEEIYADSRVKAVLTSGGEPDDIFVEMAQEWCKANGLIAE